ncbi:hypothetical protein NAC44_15430 [Allorhizobium sp. BGMRC 0089]|uniref:hypothetical protein n=1 Tax=Allorhizobium sonneratiae TaxID=2934936 RepID=UPI002033EA6F|nr:hypothetical protein [Allorhizobium sonneratiae]MCM2293720.1 hypothetical protein [Allorhizobium sonneratiae]
MASNENHRGPEEASVHPFTYNPRASLSPLHDAAIRLADLGINRPRAKTRELMNLLLSHGARAWRYSQPPATIHLYIARQAAKVPVVIRLR